ncbi:armadillo repeat-containing protein LFR [Prunus yedoensis var. nudiflora]|uniref:Armadillo repeat-containing protein LFR n=1 Tax=Prunus yedoensis var. nudiflora TaxID=2094558 RepID=A0A314YXR3_PRUYE|nr:armadillo repeat-containing protein LFR [Prunus yedoensis var. nudiflora]
MQHAATQHISILTLFRLFVEHLECISQAEQSEREGERERCRRGSRASRVEWVAGPRRPPAKRGRPFGSGGNSAAAAAAAAAETAAPSTRPRSFPHVHSSFADQNNKRIVLALQSGLKSELTWALNTLTLLSFKEKDDMRKDTTPLAKIPGLLDALLSVIDDWCDIALPKEHVKAPRVRNLGANLLVTGFGNEYEALGSNGTLPLPGLGSGSQEASVLSNVSVGLRRWSV